MYNEKKRSQNEYNHYFRPKTLMEEHKVIYIY